MAEAAYRVYRLGLQRWS